MHVTIVASPTEQPAVPPSSPPQAHGEALLRQCWMSEDDCAGSAQSLARVLTARLDRGDSVLIELHGTLGAGKTTFTRHLLRALGVQGRIKSPSYAVVEPHEVAGRTAWHFDFYRFADPREWEDAGFRDIFAAPGLKLVEWPDKAAGLLPPADLTMSIHTDDHDVRHVLWGAHTPAGRDIVSSLPGGVS